MKICPKCSASNDEGQKFCLQCGAGLVGEVEKFLLGAGLGELLPVFESNDIRDLEQLKALGSDDIKDLQSSGGTRIAYGDVIKLRKAIEGMKQPASHAAPTPEPPPPVRQESRLDILLRQVGEGNIASIYELGNLYFEGSSEVNRNLTEAASWYRRAGDKGHAGGQYSYGEALYYGRGVAEDEKESARWLRMASRQGHEEAKENYNSRLEEGRIAYLLDSADQGNAESQFRLGSIFYKGDQGQPVDKGQAAVWLRKAAAQGLGAAQCLLGAMHLQGDGIRQDPAEARRLLEAAAAQGITEATGLLATIQLQAPVTTPQPLVSSTPSVQTLAEPSQELINKVSNGYLMMLLYLVTCGTTSLVGLVMAYLNQGRVPAGYLKTHCRWQIRSFWFYLLWSSVGSMAVAIIEPGKVNEGAIVTVVAFLWYYYRALRGRTLLKQGKPAYSDKPPKVLIPVFVIILAVLVGAGVIKTRKESEKKKSQQLQTEKENRQASIERESRQRQIQAQQQSENEARLAREKAEAEEKARLAQQAAEQAEKEKQEALRKAQEAEQNAQAARSAAQTANQSSRPVSSPGFLGLNVSNGEGHQVNGVKTLIKGAFVTGVVRGSPAERAGIRKDDLVVSIAGVTVTSAHEMTEQIQRHAVGEVISVGLVHGNGSTETVSAQLVSQSELPSASVEEQSDSQATPSQSSGQQQLPEGFSDFFKQYVRDHASNNPWDLAYDYSDPCYYCYANGNASRAYIYDDIRKLVQAYPQRSYNDVNVENISVVSPDTVRLRYRFNYQYSGKKLARGTSTVDLEVRNFSGKWQITSFSEQVSRR